MQKTIEELKRAIGTGELINVIYHGGSEPGTSRMILPIQVIDDIKVRARCYTSNKVKVFYISKIELLTNDITTYTGLHQEPETLIEAIYPFINELKAAGWDIELDDTSIKLFTFFKNGKRKRTASVYLYFSEHYNVDMSYLWNDDDDEANDDQATINPRPWHVEGHCFKYLSKAVSKFIEIARETKP